MQGVSSVRSCGSYGIRHYTHASEIGGVPEITKETPTENTYLKPRSVHSLVNKIKLLPS